MNRVEIVEAALQVVREEEQAINTLMVDNDELKAENDEINFVANLIKDINCGEKAKISLDKYQKGE